jgi:predicted metal-binding membrane protein
MEEQMTVPYIVHESAMARSERHIRRLVIALIVAVVMIAVTNIVWLYYESRFDTMEYSQDGAGINNINTGEQGNILNGTEVEGEEKTESP